MASAPELAKPEHQIRVMECIFELEKVITEGGLSINDIQQIVAAAVEDGHGTLALALAMAMHGVEGALRAREGVAP